MFEKLFNRFGKKAENTGITIESSTPAVDETPASETGVAESTPTASDGPTEPIDKDDLRNRITDSMRTIFDPEIPVNIYDLGLIYEINPQDSGMVHVKMTLTTPNCPAAGILPGEVESKTRSVDGVKDCELELTFDPPWNPEMMSEGARLELGMM